MHAEALSRRRDWFREALGPGYVAWWVADDHTPSTAEGAARLDRLHEAGPTFEAFDFRQPFDAAGSPAKLDVSQVKLARKQIGR